MTYMFVLLPRSEEKMSESSHTGAIQRVLKILQLFIVYLVHIGRGIAPGCMEIEEIGGVDKRAIGNWVMAVLGSHYDKKNITSYACNVGS